MKKSFPFVMAFFFLNSLFAQNKMRSIDELIDREEQGWFIIQKWMDSAKNKIEVLKCDTTKAKDALYKTQVTTRSPMGAIIYSTGGIIIDDGWIRILGSGCTRLDRSLPDWNKGKSFKNFGECPSFFLVADDVIGGFFAINGGALGKDLGKIYYFASDNLKWEPLGLSYSDFLHFCFNGDLENFYSGLRWKNWKNDVEKLNGSQAFSFYPFLWTKEGKDINKVSRKITPVEELYSFQMNKLSDADNKN